MIAQTNYFNNDQDHKADQLEASLVAYIFSWGGRLVINIIQSNQAHDSITPRSKAFPIQQDDPE
jgi:hypothetical protein